MYDVLKQLVSWCDENKSGDSLYFVKRAREVLAKIESTEKHSNQ